MAKKKPRTPPPPRRVQAPKTRTGSSGKGAKAKPAAGIELGELGARQRLILYGVAGSGIVALIVVDRAPRARRGQLGSEGSGQDARRSRLQLQEVPGAAAHAPLLDAQSDPEAELELISAHERQALLPVGALG